MLIAMISTTFASLRPKREKSGWAYLQDMECGFYNGVQKGFAPSVALLLFHVTEYSHKIGAAPRLQKGKSSLVRMPYEKYP